MNQTVCDTSRDVVELLLNTLLNTPLTERIVTLQFKHVKHNMVIIDCIEEYLLPAMHQNGRIDA